MASVGTLSLFFPVFLPATGIAAAYFGHRALYVDWPAQIKHFLTGPGRLSRILLVFFLITNWKNLPFAWTVCLSTPALPFPPFPPLPLY
jgi:hypothetical protein